MATQTDILLVEDDPNDAYLLRHAFKRVGIAAEIEIVSTGQGAIDYLAETEIEHYPSARGLPRLILVDLNLPLVTGLEVLSWIKAQRRLASLPVVVLTASSNERDVEEARIRGAQAFLVKPVSNSERQQIVSYLQQRWLDTSPGAGKRQITPPEQIVLFTTGPRK